LKLYMKDENKEEKPTIVTLIFDPIQKVWNTKWEYENFKTEYLKYKGEFVRKLNLSLNNVTSMNDIKKEDMDAAKNEKITFTILGFSQSNTGGGRKKSKKTRKLSKKNKRRSNRRRA